MQIPQGVSMTANGASISVKGPKGEVKKDFKSPFVKISANGSEVSVSCGNPALQGTVESIISKIFIGVTEGYERKLKVIYAHFPFTFETKGTDLFVKNFLGEKVARKARIVGATKVVAKGKDVVISGPDKEAVGQTLANIKQAMKVKEKDSRIFQDGIYEA